jgi:uncharacterized membrane protein (UPF0127 family)
MLMNGKVIAEVDKADRFFTRLAGLMGKKGLADNEGLLIDPCCQVHTFFMNFPIDVLFLSESGQILLLKEYMPPGQISPYVKNCCFVLEFNGGFAARNGISLSKEISFLF